MATKTFSLSSPVLHLPVTDTDRMWYIRILDRTGAQFGEFYIALTEETADFYCPLYLDTLPGSAATLVCTDDGVPDTLFDGIVAGGTVSGHPELYPDLYREPERQQVHFSSRRGWLNDPNGLVYANGEFRMCYQHNPYGPNHGGVNVSWGLAVSPDGVHFREYPDAIRPRDSLTHIASGSAIVDETNLSGFGETTILAAYTALESEMKKGRQSIGTRGQVLEYSTDGGYTFRPLTEQPVIPVPAGESWRDPKILRMDDGSLCIAVYETYEGQNCVSFYSSADCIHWEFRSRTMDLYECPDLFRLNAAETGEELWVLYGANGMYRVGHFENFTFTSLGESHPLDYGSATYAGQTWNSHPDRDSRYHIAWFRDPSVEWRYRPEVNRGVPFAQSMTLLCRFTLHKTPDGYRMFRTPLEAFSTLRTGDPLTRPVISGETIPFSAPTDIEAELTASAPVSVAVDGHGFTYHPDTRRIDFTSGKSCVCTASGAPFRVRIVLDTHSVEFFVCGEVSATYASLEKEKQLRIDAAGSDPAGRITAWKLNSIWTSDNG